MASNENINNNQTLTSSLQESPNHNSHFSLGQCVHSSIAQNYKIGNIPGTDYTNYNQKELFKDNIIINLHKLFKHCINPIIKHFGSNVGLTSVYRNKEINKILGGVENSQHIYGYAADMVFYDGTPSAYLFNWCKLYLPQYHQLIWEYPERGNFSPFYGEAKNSLRDIIKIDDNQASNFSWVHISYIEGNNEKINSVSSTDPKIHNNYKDENTFYLDNFTHRIAIANQKILE